MGKAQLTLEETIAMFNQVALGIEASIDELTEADKAIGDGDHGIGMARGFEAVRSQLTEGEFTAINQLLKIIGMTLMSSMGGASGAIYGTFFRGGAKKMDAGDTFTTAALATLLTDGLQAVKDRGKASVGDKTMVDALEPAALKAQSMAEAPLDEALIAITEAAREGMENTKSMVATMGRAKTLGERTLGHPDPGAVSTYLILKFMTEYVS